MVAESPNAAQAQYWNETMGPVWAELQDQLDRQTAPLGLEAMRILSPDFGESVLDIGCGCGQSTIELARRVGPGGSVTGVDISRPMLERARLRPVPSDAARPRFREVDVQTGDLGEFDAAFSRFGVMFFADPTAAFANIHRALKPGGRLAFVCWRALAENALMRIPAEAAAPLLPPMPPSDPEAPGPFAFANPDRVRRILRDAGFIDVAVEAFDAEVGGADLDRTLALNLRIGPLGAALRQNPGLKDTVIGAVRAAISPYLTPAGVFMPAAVWIVSARAG
jgi:SAM-dependent methyltransferase